MKRHRKIMSDQYLTSLSPPLATVLAIGANVWPVLLGAGVGDVVATSAQWSRPGVIAIVTGAAVQLLIALLRSLFTERRDVMTAMREMIKERDERERIRQEADEVKRAEDQRIRHQLANLAQSAQLKAAMVEGGPEWHPKPLYDIEAEERAEEKRRSIAKKALPETGHLD